MDGASLTSYTRLTKHSMFFLLFAMLYWHYIRHGSAQHTPIGKHTIHIQTVRPTDRQKKHKHIHAPHTHTRAPTWTMKLCEQKSEYLLKLCSIKLGERVFYDESDVVWCLLLATRESEKRIWESGKIHIHSLNVLQSKYWTLFFVYSFSYSFYLFLWNFYSHRRFNADIVHSVFVNKCWCMYINYIVLSMGIDGGMSVHVRVFVQKRTWHRWVHLFMLRLKHI